MKYCEICGIVFIKKTEKQRVCSHSCRDALLIKRNKEISVRKRAFIHAPITEICVNCGSVYHVSNLCNYKKSEGHFCSRRCYNDARSRGYIKKKGYISRCEVCNNEIYNRPKQKRKTCSKKCCNKLRSINPSKKRKGIYTKCAICGEETYTLPCFINKRRFCSYNCLNEYRKQNSVKIDAKCTQCGVIYFIPPSHKYWKEKRKSHKYFCSKACYVAYKQIPENNHNYKKDRSEIKDPQRGIRYSNLMKTWRCKVYIRDNYTCQLCGIRSGVNNKIILNCHHIIKFSKDTTKHFDVRNGVTVCEPCHKKTYYKEELFEKQFLEITGAINDYKNM